MRLVVGRAGLADGVALRRGRLLGDGRQGEREEHADRQGDAQCRSTAGFDGQDPFLLDEDVCVQQSEYCLIGTGKGVTK